MVTLFVNTLKGPYYEHVMGSSTQWFTNVVVVAEGFKEYRVEEPLHLLRRRVLEKKERC
jgi:hypothetical protein